MGWCSKLCWKSIDSGRSSRSCAEGRLWVFLCRPRVSNRAKGLLQMLQLKGLSPVSGNVRLVPLPEERPKGERAYGFSHAAVDVEVRPRHQSRAGEKSCTYNEMFVLLVELVAVFAMSSPALKRIGVVSSHDFVGCVGNTEVCGVSHMLNCQAYEHEDCHEVLGTMLWVVERRESTGSENCTGASEWNRADDTPHHELVESSICLRQHHVYSSPSSLLLTLLYVGEESEASHNSRSMQTTRRRPSTRLPSHNSPAR